MNVMDQAHKRPKKNFQILPSFLPSSLVLIFSSGTLLSISRACLHRFPHHQLQLVLRRRNTVLSSRLLTLVVQENMGKEHVRRGSGTCRAAYGNVHSSFSSNSTPNILFWGRGEREREATACIALSSAPHTLSSSTCVVFIHKEKRRRRRRD